MNIEYFNLNQIILLSFTFITNLIIFGWAYFDEQSGGELSISDYYKSFIMWSIYMVLTYGIYIFMGSI